jgi:hypothetical protein
VEREDDGHSGLSCRPQGGIDDPIVGMDDIESPTGQGVADGPGRRWIGYRHGVRMITV